MTTNVEKTLVNAVLLCCRALEMANPVEKVHGCLSTTGYGFIMRKAHWQSNPIKVIEKGKEWL